MNPISRTFKPINILLNFSMFFQCAYFISASFSVLSTISLMFDYSTLSVNWTGYVLAQVIYLFAPVVTYVIFCILIKKALRHDSRNLHKISRQTVIIIPLMQLLALPILGGFTNRMSSKIAMALLNFIREAAMDSTAALLSKSINGNLVIQLIINNSPKFLLLSLACLVISASMLLYGAWLTNNFSLIPPLTDFPESQ